MSKQRNNQTSKSKNTEEDAAENEEPSIDLAEFETMLRSFNDESTKREVCKQIKVFEAAIEETETEAPGSRDSAEAQTIKTQKITLPISGKVIQAQGNSLKQACELVESWSKWKGVSTDDAAREEQHS